MVLAGLFFTACSEESSFTSPMNIDNQEQITAASAQPNWVQLPKSTKNTLSKKISAGKLITPDKEDKITIRADWEGGNHGQVKINATIQFKKGTVKEDTYITMELNSQTGVVTFQPHMMFNTNAIYTVEFEGIDLDGVDEDNIDFVYLNPNGDYEYMDANKIKVDVSQGKMKINKAKLPHFSRYGFIR